MSSLCRCSPASNPLVACITLRYGYAGASERLCRRIAEELQPQFAVRILTIWPVEKRSGGTSDVFFDRGIPVRRFFDENKAVGSSEAPFNSASVPSELERFLFAEIAQYQALLFIGMPVVLTLRTLLSFPGKCLLTPMDDDCPEARSLAKLHGPDLGNPVFEKIDSRLRALRTIAPSVFIRHHVPEVEQQAPKVQQLFVDLKLSLINEANRQ